MILAPTGEAECWQSDSCHVIVYVDTMVPDTNGEDVHDVKMVIHYQTLTEASFYIKLWNDALNSQINPSV